jgi:hypothetical protein
MANIMKKNHAIFSGAQFSTLVNVITLADGPISYEVQKWGNMDAVPHPVPFPIESWVFDSLNDAVTFAKAVEMD